MGKDWYAIMDDKGIIEDFDSYEEALDSVDRVRDENEDIAGDLKLIQIIAVYN